MNGRETFWIVPPDRDAILAAVRRARSDEFRNSLQGMANPYGNGHAAEKPSFSVLSTVPLTSKLLMKRPAKLPRWRPESANSPLSPDITEPEIEAVAKRASVPAP